MKKVLLITRLATQNAGNEALSTELINFARSMLPGCEIRAMDRYPNFFSQFKLSSLGQATRDIPESFDEICRKLIRQFAASDAQLAPLADESLVKLDNTAKELPNWIRSFKRSVGFRRRMAALGMMGNSDASDTIRSCQWADLLVWNPAGEIYNPGHFSRGSGDQAFRLLLLVRIAQLSNVRTMVINHSLETSDPALRAVIKHVYSHAVCIAVRDHKSYEVAIDLGVDKNKLVDVPEMVFLVAESERAVAPSDGERFDKGTICLSVNGRHAYNRHAEWDSLIVSLKQLNRPLGFLTNAMNHDIPFIRDLARQHGIKFVDRQPSYREIRGFFRDVDLLIGSRFHANIIALCTGVPVISLEASQFKMTAAFDQMQYPIPTTQMGTPSWPQQVMAHVKNVLGERHDEISTLSREIANRQAALVRNSYQRIFSLESHDGTAV